MTANEMRQRVIDEYNRLIGRNRYSQARRNYVVKKYSDGLYYSDCSSSVTKCYDLAGYPVRHGGTSLPNTVGIYHSADLVDVPVIIKNGIIQNPEVLRVGDLLLFAGTDTSRKGAGYVGHVEMVHSIVNGKVKICGHGSGTPRITDLNAYCTSRYNSKTKTPLGHKGLIKVRRRIADDAPTEPEHMGVSSELVEITGNTVNLREGASTAHRVAKVAKRGDRLEVVGVTNGYVPVLVDGKTLWVSMKYIK